jgi:hypothetical protein
LNPNSEENNPQITPIQWVADENETFDPEKFTNFDDPEPILICVIHVICGCFSAEFRLIRIGGA